MQLPFDIPLQLVLVVAAFVIILLAGIVVKAAEARIKAAEARAKSAEALALNANLPETIHRYVAQTTLISKREREFLAVLDPMAADLGLRICPQVRLADVIQVARDSENRRSSFLHIAQKHLDFVLVEQQSFQIYACIELQDSTHNASDRKKADNDKAAALQSANVPLLVFNSIRELQKHGIAILDDD